MDGYSAPGVVEPEDLRSMHPAWANCSIAQISTKPIDQPEEEELEPLTKSPASLFTPKPKPGATRPPVPKETWKEPDGPQAAHRGKPIPSSQAASNPSGGKPQGFGEGEVVLPAEDSTFNPDFGAVPAFGGPDSGRNGHMGPNVLAGIDQANQPSGGLPTRTNNAANPSRVGGVPISGAGRPKTSISHSEVGSRNSATSGVKSEASYGIRGTVTVARVISFCILMGLMSSYLS